MTKTLRSLPVFLLLLIGWLSAAQASFFQEDELLPADEAFAFEARVLGPDRVLLRWKVADGYYLYRSRFKLRSRTPGIELGEVSFPKGEIKNDEFFGKVEIYHGQVDIEVPLKRSAGAPDTLKLEAVSQGCAERGVCYPPHTQVATLKLPPAGGEAQKGDGKALEKLKALGGGLGFDDEVPDPEVVFQVNARADGPDALVVRWDIDECCYLYRHRFRFALVDGEGVTLGEPQIPPGTPKTDEFFGQVEIYHGGSVEARIPVNRTRTEATRIRLKVGYQGCAADRGICYPPQTRTLDIELPPGSGANVAPATAPSAEAPQAPITEQDKIAARLLSGNAVVTVLSFFGFGLLLAFTPCVFPMVPILSGIIIGQGSSITPRRAFMLSLSYVLAMAVTYTAAGVFAGLSGENLQAAFQNPWILSAFAAIFVLLALSMFGFYDLQMPSFIQSRLTEISNRQRGGSLTGAAVMGFLSALIVGPCVAAPLAGALIYIGQTGDPYLGGAALFALSMGMGVPLIAIGTGFGKWLPKAGGWMNAVKAVFGVLLLGVAIWMLERIVPPVAAMFLWGTLLIVSAVYMGALERLDVDASGWQRLWKGLGFVLLAYGVLLLVGVAAGGKDVYQPLRGVSFGTGGGTAVAGQVQQGVRFKRIKTVEDLQRELAAASAAGKPVMLDFYADWCTDCHRLEKYTFADPKVAAILKDAVLLQADVTANDEADKALLKHFRIPGPPSIMFFGPDGKERRAYRLVGYMDPEKFADHARAALAPPAAHQMRQAPSSETMQGPTG